MAKTKANKSVKATRKRVVKKKGGRAGDSCRGKGTRVRTRILAAD
jgi:hypothetical protein